MKTIKQLLGARIKEMRKAKGLSQAEFSEKVEIAANYLSRIEVGAKYPSIETLEKMSAVLDTEIRDLFDFHHLQEEHPDINYLLKDATFEQRKLAYKIIKTVIR
jgi:transcriptional regulator with XRE-family HTH domain